MEEAGIDVLLATSKHNVQYLLGGHRAFFFDYMDAMGLSRYLPVVVYPKGAPDKAAFFGHRLENFQQQVKPFWTPEVQATSSGSVDVMKKAAEYLKKLGVPTPHRRRDGVPADGRRRWRCAAHLPDAEIVDALFVLERLRARKSPAELEMLRDRLRARHRSMHGGDRQARSGHHQAGDRRRAARREEINRGLTFEYCLIAAGASHNRAPSEQRWEEGDVLSVDSGGNYHGYIGDLARMAILGEPDAELEDLLAEIEAIQRAAFKPIKAGVMGGEIYAAGGGAGRASRSSTTTCTSWRTAWGWSATRRRA